MHDCAACEVEHAPTMKQRALTTPGHVADGEVGEREPERRKEQHAAKPHPLGEGSHNQGRGDDGKRHLKGDEEWLRNRAGERLRSDSLQKEFVSAADDRLQAAAVAEGKAVAVGHPQQAHDSRHCQALHQYGEHVLAPHKAAVKQREPRQRHEQHQRCRHDHPRGVAAIGAHHRHHRPFHGIFAAGDAGRSPAGHPQRHDADSQGPPKPPRHSEKSARTPPRSHRTHLHSLQKDPPKAAWY